MMHIKALGALRKSTIQLSAAVSTINISIHFSSESQWVLTTAYIWEIENSQNNPHLLATVQASLKACLYDRFLWK